MNIQLITLVISLMAFPILASPVSNDSPVAALPTPSITFTSIGVGQPCDGNTFALTRSSANGTVLTVSECASKLCYARGDESYLCRTLDDQTYRYVTHKSSCGYSEYGVLMIERCEDGFDCTMTSPLQGTCSPSNGQSKPFPPELTILPSKYNAALGEPCNNFLDPVGRIFQHITCRAGLTCNRDLNACKPGLSPQIRKGVDSSSCGYISDSLGATVLQCSQGLKLFNVLFQLEASDSRRNFVEEGDHNKHLKLPKE
ncbi:hypothetical protein HDU97_007429 [Phlyctochytrium planicorne]|nr:hypothetical protein HDU97_007429 [Phlyctochytrium planicorne]